MTFTTYAKVENPGANDAQVLNMVYHVQQNGVEIANSGFIPASRPQRTTDQQGKPIDRYSTNWQYTVPTNVSGLVEYRIYAKINCGYKQGTQAAPQSVNGGRVSPQSPIRVGLLQTIVEVINRIIGAITGRPSVPATTTSVIDYSQFNFEDTQPAYYQKYVFPISTKADTIKLETFEINPTPTPRVELSCKQMRFWLP